MTDRITPRDWELISSYIDGELKAKDRAHCEARLKNEPELRQILEDLRYTRSLVRKLEPLRAPRSFTLTPAMAGARRRSFWPAPAFQWASAIATVLLIFVLGGDFLGFLRPQPPFLTAAPASIFAEATAPTSEFALEEDSIGAEMAVPEVEELAQGAAEEPPGETDSLEVNGTPEPVPAAGDTIRAASQTADSQEAGSAPLLEGAQPEELGIQAGAGGGPSGGNLQIRMIEAVLGAIALVTALAALAFRRRSLS